MKIHNGWKDEQMMIDIHNSGIECILIELLCVFC